MPLAEDPLRNPGYHRRQPVTRPYADRRTINACRALDHRGRAEQWRRVCSVGVKPIAQDRRPHGKQATFAVIQRSWSRLPLKATQRRREMYVDCGERDQFHTDRQALSS